MPREYDIVLVGPYFYDQIYVGLQKFPELGCEVHSQEIASVPGGMAITCIALKRLGVRVGWLTCFGSDPYSLYIKQLLEAEGVDLSLAVHLEHPFRQITTALPYLGERAFVTYSDPLPEHVWGRWEESLQGCNFSHLHIGGLALFDKMILLTEHAKRQGASLSADCQDGDFLRNGERTRHQILPRLNVFMPNAREAMLIAETSDLQQALSCLMEITQLVVIKDGSNGAWIGENQAIYHQEALLVSSVVDTTGAGDCFNAGFLFGYTVEKQPAPVCAQYGNICGGLSVAAIGGATAAPTRQELQKWLVG